MRAMKEIFDTHLRAQARQPDPAMTPTPKFFAPPPPKPVRQPGPIVSAPVSRTVPDGSVRPQYEQDPTRVTLTPDEKLLAKASGLTELERARGKARVQGMKARGELT
jgi:hypothetical protein